MSGPPELRAGVIGYGVMGKAHCCSTSTIFCAILLGMATTVEELMKNAVDARRVAQTAIGLAVREARAADWSWDRISAALGGTPNGETLRRNFGGDKDAAS
jgi:hypothetical protein